MPRIRIIDKMFEQCKAVGKRHASSFDFIKENYKFKQGDLVRCTHNDFKEYSNCKVICIAERINKESLVLVYVPDLPTKHTIIWGDKVLALGINDFVKI